MERDVFIERMKDACLRIESGRNNFSCNALEAAFRLSSFDNPIHALYAELFKPEDKDPTSAWLDDTKDVDDYETYEDYQSICEDNTQKRLDWLHEFQEHCLETEVYREWL